jgi:3-oxoacyl-[acyl-carrier protein] reductase
VTEDGFAGRTALVTGASGGIGAALARRLAAGGADLALSYRGHGADADRLAAELGGTGRRVVTVPADLADPAAPAALVAEAARRLGPVDLLVAAAGDGTRTGWDALDIDDWDRTLAVNLRAPFLLAQRVLPGMVERGYGRVLFFSSVAAFTGGVVGPHYAASKAGLHGLVHHLAARVAAHGVTVNAIAPALVAGTRMLPGDPGDLAGRIPVGRLGGTAETADLAYAMLRNGYLTSKIILVDGGIHPY